MSDELIPVGSQTLTKKGDDKKKKVEVEPFKLTDVPIVMRKKGWEVAARLQDIWFAGESFIISGEEKGGRPIKSYLEKNPPEVKFNAKVVTEKETLATADWLFSFPIMVDKLEELKKVLNTANAKKEICNYLKREKMIDFEGDNKIIQEDIEKLKEKFPGKDAKSAEGLTTAINDMIKEIPGKLKKVKHPWSNKKSIEEFHYYWQFQQLKIDSREKKDAFADFDGLDAALYKFTLNAGIAEVETQPIIKGREIYGYTVKIPRVVIYGRDIFDFSDDGMFSQYLGCWNKEDVKVFNVIGYTIVNNKHYCEWRKKNKKGGDMIVFTGAKMFDTSKVLNFTIMPGQ